MSDSYQPIYDAVRSRISGGNIAETVREVLRSSFDSSQLQARTFEALDIFRNEHTRPSVLFRPQISRDGDKWCVLYGENLQDGVAGFGESPAAAMENFDQNWQASPPKAEGREP